MTGAGQAVVVGATGTIGQAVIRRLTGRGLPVLAVARGRDDLDKLAAADELVTPCPADIGSNDAIGAIGSALTGLEGPVRMAVFAAGLPVRGSADTIDPDAIAIGSKDVYEPDLVDFGNITDYDCFNSVLYYTPGLSGAQRDVDHDGGRDLYGPFETQLERTLPAERQRRD